jgi:hypothetical protein
LSRLGFAGAKPVFMVVRTFNFFGDGLRDAADLQQCRQHLNLGQTTLSALVLARTVAG